MISVLEVLTRYKGELQMSSSCVSGILSVAVAQSRDAPDTVKQGTGPSGFTVSIALGNNGCEGGRAS